MVLTWPQSKPTEKTLSGLWVSSIYLTMRKPEPVAGPLEAAQNAQTSDWRAADTWPEPVRRAEMLVSEAHIEAIKRFQAKHDMAFTLVGFHGQTVLHQPEAGVTVQIVPQLLRAPQIVLWSASFGWPILPMVKGPRLRPCFMSHVQKSVRGTGRFEYWWRRKYYPAE